MAFYKKFQSKLNNLWYPKVITSGDPISTDKIADKLALLSTVTCGDTYVVVKNLGGVMADYMVQGRTVKIEGMENRKKIRWDNRVGSFCHIAFCYSFPLFLFQPCPYAAQ